MGFLLQITLSCPRALSRQVAGAGCRWWCWCCELALHVVETGCWCWCWCWVPGAGVGAGAVSWLCTWWRQVAGADRLLVLLAVRQCRRWVLAVRVVETAGAGAGAVSWSACGGGWAPGWALAVRVVETGCRVLGARWVPGAGAGAGYTSAGCWCWAP